MPHQELYFSTSKQLWFLSADVRLHWYMMWQFMMCLKVLLCCRFIACVYRKPGPRGTFSLRENKKSE